MFAALPASLSQKDDIPNFETRPSLRLWTQISARKSFIGLMPVVGEKKMSKSPYPVGIIQK